MTIEHLFKTYLKQTQLDKELESDWVKYAGVQHTFYTICSMGIQMMISAASQLSIEEQNEVFHNLGGEIADYFKAASHIK